MIVRYDKDWLMTGPLIEKYKIHLGESREYESNAISREYWLAGTWESDETEDYLLGKGGTPLIAVCELILALKKAGKL